MWMRWQRGDGGRGGDDKWLTCSARWRHVVRVSAQRQRDTHDADAGPRSEIGEIGSRRSFLRVTHVYRSTD